MMLKSMKANLGCCLQRGRGCWHQPEAAAPRRDPITVRRPRPSFPKLDADSWSHCRKICVLKFN